MTGTHLIFLDVDGVLNTWKDHEKMTSETFFVNPNLVDRVAEIIVKTDARVVLSSKWRETEEMANYIDEMICESLCRLRYENLGRLEPDQEPNPSLYSDVMISMTPDLSKPSYKPKPAKEYNHQTRTDEIILWLKENVQLNMEVLVKKSCSEHSRKQASHGVMALEKWVMTNKIRVKNFICLDDMNLAYFSCYRMKSEIGRHLVLTDTSKGIGNSHVKLAIDILNDENFDINEWAENCFVPCDKRNCFHALQKEEQFFLEDARRSRMLTLESLNLGDSRRSRTSPERELKKEDSSAKRRSEPVPPPQPSTTVVEMNPYDFVL